MARLLVRTNPDKISWPHLAALNGASKVTVSIRLKPTTVSNTDNLLNQIGANLTGAGVDSGLAINYSGALVTGLRLSARNNDSTQFHAYGLVLTAGVDNHILVVYDGAEMGVNRLRLYTANTLRTIGSSGGSVPATLGTCDQPLTLGQRSGSSSHGGGEFCEIAIWTGVVLDSTERTNLYGGAPANSLQAGNLVFYAPMDSSYTSGVNDLIGPYTGTLTGTSIVSHPSGIPTSDPGAPGALASGTASGSSTGTTTTTVSVTTPTGGTAPYTYQWYRDTTPGFTPSGANDVVGATSATLNDTGLTATTTYYYVCVVTDNVAASDASNEVEITTGGSGSAGRGRVTLVL